MGITDFPSPRAGEKKRCGNGKRHGAGPRVTVGRRSGAPGPEESKKTFPLQERYPIITIAPVTLTEGCGNTAELSGTKNYPLSAVPDAAWAHFLPTTMWGGGSLGFAFRFWSDLVGLILCGSAISGIYVATGAVPSTVLSAGSPSARGSGGTGPISSSGSPR